MSMSLGFQEGRIIPRVMPPCSHVVVIVSSVWMDCQVVSGGLELNIAGFVL